MKRNTRVRAFRLFVRGAFVAVLVVGGACSGGSGGATAEEAGADTLTRRQRDSLIGTLPLPGAGAVGSAQRASDALRARAEAHDSLGGP